MASPQQQQPHHNDQNFGGHYPPNLNNATYPPQPSHSRTMSHSTTAFGSSESVGKHKGFDEESNQKDLQWDSTAPARPQEPVAKKWYMKLIPKSVPIRLFLATVILETIIDCAIQGDIYARLQVELERHGSTEGSEKIRRVIVYLIIFALAHVFQLGLAIDAIISQNTLQFFFLTAFNFIFFVYSLIQAGEIREINNNLPNQGGVTAIPINVLTIISHVVIGLSEVAFIALGLQIWREFGWKVYKFLGADIAVKRMFANYQIFLCLVKFDLFFWFGFTLQLILFVLKTEDWEYSLTIAALPLAILLLIEGHLAARYENKWLMGSFMLGCSAACVYFVYKLYRIWEDDDFEQARNSLTSFAAISLFFLLITCVWGVIVMQNFGRGLLKHLSKQPTMLRRNNTRAATVDFGNRKSTLTMAANPNRMSIE